VTYSANATITANYVTPVAPTVTVTPSASTITTGQPLSVVVAVAAPSGSTVTPTGSVVLTSGSYTSGTVALMNGSVTIGIAAGALATATDSLKATYTPDTGGAVNYTSAAGTGSVTVNPPPAPTMSVSLSGSTILISQALTATVTVSGSSGNPTPSGSVAVSGGGLSPAVSGTLSNGSVTLTIPANSLTAGTDTLTFTYTPDSGSSPNYSSGTKTASVTVTGVYTLTVNTTNPASGTTITVSPADQNGHATGASPLTLSYAAGAQVTLTAPATASSNAFSAWSGCTSASGTTCNVTVNGNMAVTAAYTTSGPSITVSPATASVTIGNSQTFTATASGLSPGTVTWSVAAGSGTISSAGVYQSPYPAPTTVTVTATSTANTSIKGTATITLVAPTTALGPAISVDAATVTRAISPLIYGMNGYLLDPTTAQNANITVVRWGGDDTSRYNYQTNVVNSASDYYFENFSGANSMLPNGSTGQGTSFNQFLSAVTSLGGVKAIGTANVLGWVSNSTVKACSFTKTTYPNQQSFNGDNCGNGVESDGKTDLFGNNTIAQITSVAEPPPSAPGAGNATTWAQGTWTGGWVNCLLSNSSYCNGAGSRDADIWDLDNEPAWWDAVHRDVHPNPSTYDEVTNGGIGTALAIKTVDPNAQVSGPVIDYWWNYFYSKQDIESGWSGGPCYQPWSNPTDREAHGGTPMIVYYLQQMAANSNTYGTRLLDYLTIHAYVAASYNGSAVSFTTAGDTGEQQVRMKSTRALWDSTYTDPNFPQPNYKTDANYTSGCNVPLQAPQIIPMMQGWITSGWTGTTYAAPGTSIDEYNFGGLESINGAVTQADVLGIFGKYGLTMGVFWPTTNYTQQVPGNMAFEMYRNYDGSKSTFGDNELSSTTGDQSKLAVYAASRTSDGALTIMVINKTYGDLTDTLSLNNLTSTAASAQVYQYSNANLNAITSQPAATITAPVSPSTTGTITATFPAQSITLLVIPSH
jgi:hypothetical protein